MDSTIYIKLVKDVPGMGHKEDIFDAEDAYEKYPWVDFNNKHFFEKPVKPKFKEGEIVYINASTAAIFNVFKFYVSVSGTEESEILESLYENSKDYTINKIYYSPSKRKFVYRLISNYDKKIEVDTSESYIEKIKCKYILDPNFNIHQFLAKNASEKLVSMGRLYNTKEEAEEAKELIIAINSYSQGLFSLQVLRNIYKSISDWPLSRHIELD